MRFEGNIRCKKPKNEHKLVDITLNFKMDLFGVDTTFCMYFTVLENVSI